jgi:deazaflavin-dependent oxidoreductase (nitroreductase family)
MTIAPAAPAPTAPKVPPSVNRIMISLLRSPLHGLLSKSVMLITFTGRKTGRSYTTPVNYFRDGNNVTVFSHATWHRNLRGGAPVTVRLQGRDYSAQAEAIEHKAAVVKGLTEYLRCVPRDARFYHVTLDSQKRPNLQDVERASATVTMLRIRLT